MNKQNELRKQELSEIAHRQAAQLLALSGANQNQPAEVIYFNLREIITATLWVLEMRGYGIDQDHPQGFEGLLEGLQDAITDRLNRR